MFTWTALYDDNSTLSQFTETNEEHLFKEIDQSKLKRFGISNGFHNIVVDFRNGRFYVDGLPMKVGDSGDKDEKYRLIYFRRVRRNIGTTTTKKSQETEHFIGYQTIQEGVNKQVMISVKDDKNILFDIHIK